MAPPKKGVARRPEKQKPRTHTKRAHGYIWLTYETEKQAVEVKDKIAKFKIPAELTHPKTKKKIPRGKLKIIRLSVLEGESRTVLAECEAPDYAMGDVAAHEQIEALAAAVPKSTTGLIRAGHWCCISDMTP